MKAKPILLAILLLTFSKFNLVEAQTNPLTQEEIVTQINSILSEVCQFFYFLRSDYFTFGAV